MHIPDKVFVTCKISPVSCDPHCNVYRGSTYMAQALVRRVSRECPCGGHRLHCSDVLLQLSFTSNHEQFMIHQGHPLSMFVHTSIPTHCTSSVLLRHSTPPPSYPARLCIAMTNCDQLPSRSSGPFPIHFSLSLPFDLVSDTMLRYSLFPP